MKFLVVLVICLFYLFSLGNACREDNKSCKTNSDCCSFDCVRGRCNPESKPSCNTVQCPPGEMCILKQVYCIRAPCPPMPTCVPALNK